MVGGLVLLLVLSLALALAFGRREARPAGPPGPHPDTIARLEAAVARGVLSRAQADAVLAVGVAPAHHEAPAAPRRVPAAVEILGYVGAVFALVGAAVLVGQAWDALSTAGRLVIIGGAALAMLVAGALVDEEADPVLWRLRGFLWLLSSVAVTGLAALVAVDLLDWEGEPVAITAGAAAAAYGLALWQLKDRPAEQACSLIGALVTLGGLVALVGDEVAVGLTVVAVGVVWLALGTRDVVPPQPVALGLGSVTLLVGPAIVASGMPRAGMTLGLALAGALIALGTSHQVFGLTTVGAVGMLAYLPMTLTEFFGDTVGVPVLLLVAGLVLLALMVLLVRRHQPRGGSGPGGLMAPHNRSAAV